MEGERSLDNCYLLTSSRTYWTTLLNNSNIWRRRLDHISHKSLNEIIEVDVVLGILKMKVDLGKIYSSSQMEKQLRSSHKMMQHLSTTKILEVIHMDLMRPM